MEVAEETNWNPASHLTRRHETYHGSQGTKSAVVILNQPIKSRKLLVDLCSKGDFNTCVGVATSQKLIDILASCIACADGGANRLKTLNLSSAEEELCVSQTSVRIPRKLIVLRSPILYAEILIPFYQMSLHTTKTEVQE